MSASPNDVEIIGPDGVSVGVVRRPPPPIRRLWLHLAFLGLTTLFTTLYGAVAFGPQAQGYELQLWWGFLIPPAVALRILLTPALLFEGLSFSLPLMAILLTHEAGHFIACRLHRLDATLPLFLPVPFGIGTLGAFIRIRSPLANKRELFDVGASGPLAGFVATLPVLVAGIALSQPVSQLPTGGYLSFGEPLAFRAVELVIHPELARGGDLLLHPMGFAAWFGLLVTALNLLPFGQLDGGHITYALFGRLQRRWSWLLLIGLAAMGTLWVGWWVWLAVAVFMGVRHPWIPDEAARLDTRRSVLGWICVAVFVLCFTPVPVSLVP